MSTIKSLENRIIDLERQVAQLSTQLLHPRKVRKGWLSSMAGCMADYPEFDEVVRSGREWRESFKQPDSPNSPTKKITGVRSTKTRKARAGRNSA